MRGGPAEGAPGGAGIGSDLAIGPGLWWPWWGGGLGHLLAVDLSGAEPAFASEVKLTSTNTWWNFSDAFTANGLVYTSHQASEFDPSIDPPPYIYMTWDGKNYVTATNDPPPGAWVQRYYLDVVDFADAHDPIVRAPVNVPGTLIGLHRNGELLYTKGYMGDPFTYSGKEVIAASSYDGVAAHLVASLEVEQTWPRPVISDSGLVYLGSPQATNNTVQVWTVPNSGKFELVDTIALDSAAQQFEKIDDLLVVQSAEIQLFDARNPAGHVEVGSGHASLCYGVLLDGADGTVERGVWLPIGWYGVIHIPVEAAQ
jgi:hypothetical protein